MKSDIQFVVDAQGNRTSFIVPLDEYEGFLEYLEDEHVAKAARESKHEELVPWEQIKVELVTAGKLDA